MALREFHYRLTDAVRGHWPGHHRSASGDGGFEFRGHAPLADAPDARRLDLHASLRDPFGRWIVRLNSQRQSVPVVLVADLSASMAFAGPPRRQDVLADLAESLAWSAWRTGDSFGFVGCDDRVRTDLLLPQTRRRGAGTALATQLRGAMLQGPSADALAQAHRHLPARRCLVFLVSDFHLPMATLDAALSGLAAHQVQPVVLWDAAEYTLSPARGLAQVADPERGGPRWLWWRPALRERWSAARDERRAELAARFAAWRLMPLFVEGDFDPDAVTRHFLA